MSGAWGRYDRAWTDLSLNELSNFAEWMNDILGYHPTIIGGWAVWFYNRSGLGSRDIDILLPSWEIRDRTIELYLRNNGYELRERAFGEAEWIKLLVPGNPDSETYLDVCTLQDRNIVHGRDIEIPWSIATEWQRGEKVGPGEIYVPEPEPLLVLKAKAAWDRSFDLERTGGDSFLRDKVRKDRFDMLSLITNQDIKEETIAEIISRYGFGECFQTVLWRALSDTEVLTLLGIGEDAMVGLYENISMLCGGIE